MIGLEPTRRKTPDPKSGASTNFATRATALIFRVQRYGKKPRKSTLLLLFFAIVLKNKGFGSLYYCVAPIVPILACDIYFYVWFNAELGVSVIKVKGGAGREAHVPTILY